MNKFLAGYLIATFAFTMYLAPKFFIVRLTAFAPTLFYVNGIPVAFYQIYFFTVLSFALGVLVAYLRKASIFIAVWLSACGLAFFEFYLSIAYVFVTWRWLLLIPRAGLPYTGWPGFSTWALADLIVASLAFINYERFALDGRVALVGTIFVSSMLVWVFGLNLQAPPVFDSLPVYLANTVAEVSGSLLIPLALTGKPIRERQPFFILTRDRLRAVLDSKTAKTEARG